MPERRAKTDRRNARDRRRGDRRRKGELRFVAIEITADELRIAERRRSDVPDAPDRVSLAVVPWRKEAATFNSEDGRVELAAALRIVARDFNLATADVRLVLGGDYCVVRTMRGTADEVRSELQQLEQRSRMYLTLGPGEKTLVSETWAVDARHSQGVAVACNRATLDAIQYASEAVGVEIDSVEPALAALCRAVSRLPDAPQQPYLIVHVNSDSIDVGICHQGDLLMDYRPGGRARVDDLPTILKNHLERLTRHVARMTSGEAKELKCVYLCGHLDGVREAAKQFQRATKLEVRTVRAAEVQATWQLPDDDAVELSAPALGSLLATYLPPGEQRSPNLMLHILESKREPLRPILVRSAAPLVAALLIALGFSTVNRRDGARLADMQLEMDQLAVAQAKARELQLQLTAASSKLAEMDKLAEQLPPEIGDEVVRRIGTCMPTDVWLTNLELADGKTANVEGASFLEAGVYDFVNWLKAAPGFADVAINRTSPGASPSGPVTNFLLELSLGKSQPAPKVARHE
jgi:hypothetical protein